MNQVAGLSAWVLVDVTTSEVVGHFDVTLADSTASLGRVIIDPKRRGQGYAHTLVNHAISLTRQLGASLLSLNVIVGNDTAIHVYEQAGFCKTDSNERPGVHKMTLRLAATR
ncbi:GNAT family N-acetyltransferase [Cumulibacter soli]|uniref:GNAT family N-acetyltransferase n=1 Tax=Cumulibacter soli TaxID=2546344 RepID=UPI0014191EF7|nr:GNAT family N-acetyltransferase [Cumulibacter soli]